MPLPFFVQAATTWARSWLKHGDEARALEEAEKGLNKRNNLLPSEGEDRCVRQVWSADELSTLGTLAAAADGQALDFAALARLIVLPMLEHLEEPELP
jgi:hypothetical protein